MLAKLGGYFDYALFQEELRQVLSDKDALEREFKAQALTAPEFKDKAFGKVPPYDFSSNSIFLKDPFKEQEWRETVSFEKPREYAQIATEPKNFFDFDDYARAMAKPAQPTMQKSVVEYHPPSVSQYKP